MNLKRDRRGFWLIPKRASLRSGRLDQHPKKCCPENQFSQFFQNSFNKTYNDDESEELAAKNFIENTSNIEAHNKKTNVSYTRGTAVDSDLTFAEKKINRTGLKFPKNRPKPSITIEQILVNVTTPEAGKWDHDWNKFRKEKNQKYFSQLHELFPTC